MRSNAQQSNDTIAPTSQITGFSSAATLSAGQPVVITGTATDSGGGLVAVVEVSTDGGTSWHRATGWDRAAGRHRVGGWHQAKGWHLVAATLCVVRGLHPWWAVSASILQGR